MAHHRHKRDTNARTLPSARTVAGGIAVLATVPAVTIGVLSANPSTPDRARGLLATDALATGMERAADPAERAPVLSRGDSRADRLAAAAGRSSVRLATQQARKAALAATLQAVRSADTHRWTTTDLNLWTESGPTAVQVGEIPTGKRVLVTGREAAGRVEIVVDGRSRWVTAGYLDTEQPAAAQTPAPAAGLSTAPCPDGSVENGLTSNAVAVYRAVCHAFPQITTYGGWDAHGEHASGKALDIMTSDVTLGTAIANFLQAHASELHLYDVIWRQHIWTPVRASEGWRYMPSRGSATANHYDHVHVSTY